MNSTDYNYFFKAKPDEIGEFQKLFWDEQCKLNKAKKGGERYHPEIIRFVL